LTNLACAHVDEEHLAVSGAHFNFIETFGFGLAVPVQPHLFLTGGVRFEHISNAGISVNPGYNGIQAYVGFRIPL
jgi:hypothetical protein